MADRNDGAVTPEYLAVREAISRALLDPNNLPSGGGYAIGIAGILNALAGHGGIAQVENMRRNQLGRVGESNVPTDRRVVRPPPRGVDPNAQSSISPPRPPMPLATAPAQIEAPPRPRTRPVRPTQPSRVGQPASAPPDAITTGATVPPQSPTGAQAPAGLTPERGDEIVRQAMTAHNIPSYDPNQDADTFRRLTGGDTAWASPSTSMLIKKYGPELAAATVSANSNQSMAELFHKHYKAGDPYTAFLDSLPRELEQGRDPNTITADQWLTAQNAMNTNLGITPSSDDGRMNLGGQQLAQADTGASPWQPEVAQITDPNVVGDMLTDEAPSGAQPPIRPQAPPSAAPTGGATGVSGSAAGPASSLPFNLPQSLPASEQIETLERQLSSNVYVMMSSEERKAITEEYRRLIAPQRIEVGDVSASYKYDPNTNSFVLDPQSIGRKPGTYQIGGESITGVPGAGNRVDIPQYGVSGQPAEGSTQSTDSGSPLDPRRPQHPLFQGGRQTGNLPADLERYRQDQRITGETRSRTVANEDKSVNDALEAYDLSIPLRSDLGFIRTLTERSGPFSEGGMYRGPGSDWVQSALRILQNFLPPGSTIPATESVRDAEGIRKVIVQLGSAATRQLSNRPANFEFQTILNAFPGLEVSYEGATLLLDYLDQVQERMQETGRAAEAYAQNPVSQRGGWRRVVGELDRANPIMITVPAGKWLSERYGINEPIRITTRRISPQEERTLPSDTYFMRDGKLHRGEGLPQ